MKHIGKHYQIIGIFVLIIFLLPSISSVAQTTPERTNTLWTSGYWAGPGVNNPAHWGPSWESKYMYEVLFDWNSLKADDAKLIGFIGESLSWNDDGTELTITLKDEAKWSDGTQITSDDVIWSFWNFYAGKGGPLNATFAKRIDSMTKVSDTELTVNANPGFEFSRSIYFQFVGRWQILPKHIWTQMLQDERTNSGGAYLMTNNWLDPNFPEEYKVASGLYFPHSVAIDKSWALYQRNDDWWGVGVIADELPKPTFIGMKSYPSNFAQSADYISDGIDWYGGFIQSIDREIERNSALTTYYGQKEPYFASLSSVVEIAPNHLRYPLSEPWLRRAMAYAINIEDMIDIGASGYLEPARVGRLDDRSPTHADLYDPAVQEQYGFNFNLTKANELLAKNCLDPTTPSNPSQPDSTPVGKWYTVDAPLDQRDGLIDAYPQVPGFNVKIGPYTLESPLGWSDFTLHATTFQLQMMGIELEIKLSFPDYSVFVAHHRNMDFDLLLYGLGPGLIDQPLTNFNYFAGPAGQGVNVTGWYNPEYVQLLQEFETASAGSVEEKTVASELQEELGKDLPSIPLFGNGFWSAYNTRYWVNWPTEDDGRFPPVAMWSFGNTGLMHQVMLELNQGTGEPAVSSNADWPLLTGMFSIFLLVTVKLRKRKL